MPGTVRLVDRDKLLFCFPYDPVTNDELRDAADNRVRWDARRRGFTLSVTSLRYNPSWPSRLASSSSGGASTPIRMSASY